ncbi:MAG: flagellar export chaperone FliS [Bryobacteraceae bacterium]
MDSSVRNSYLENKILSADAVELVQILYQSALEAVENARRHLKQGEIAARSKQIGKACAILTELTVSLNHDAGGDLSRTLSDLYDYMRRRLLEANFKQIEPPLAEVSKLLATLLEGWLNCKVSALAPAVQSHPLAAPGYASPGQAPSAYASQGYASQYTPQETAWPADPEDQPVSPHRRITVSY